MLRLLTAAEVRHLKRLCETGFDRSRMSTNKNVSTWRGVHHDAELLMSDRGEYRQVSAAKRPSVADLTAQSTVDGEVRGVQQRLAAAFALIRGAEHADVLIVNTVDTEGSSNRWPRPRRRSASWTQGRCTTGADHVCKPRSPTP